MTMPHAEGPNAEFAEGYADARYDLEHQRDQRPAEDRSAAYQRGHTLGWRQTLIVRRLRLLEQAPAEEYFVDLGPVRRLLEMAAVLVELLDGFDLAVTVGGVDSRQRSPDKASVSQTLQYLERLLGQALALIGVEYSRMRNMPDVVDLDDDAFAELLQGLRDLGDPADPADPADP